MAENRRNALFFMFFAVSIGAQTVRTSAHDHLFSVGDHVPLHVNKVGPFRNPSETYRYFDLPFCLPGQITEKKETLGEVLNGDRLIDAKYQLNFREDKNSEPLCKKKLTKIDAAKFRDAVKNDYYFQMYYDDLPVWGFIGKVQEGQSFNETMPRYYLFKHIEFTVLYNNKQVIEISAFSDPNFAVDITEDKETEIDFMYSVHWDGTSVPFEKRMNKYSKSSLLPQHLEVHWFSIINSKSSLLPQHLEVHWFSIINSCATVLLLTVLLATIFMRILKNDFIKYSIEDGQEDSEKGGWKYIHGDVFRYPPYKSLLCAVLGSGIQLLILSFSVFVLAFFGVFYPYNRGSLYTSLVTIHALTSVVAGFTASSFYNHLEGTNWAKTLLLSWFLFPGPLLLTFAFVNTVAIAYSATAALPFGTIVVILLVWTLVTFPLHILGGIVGNNYKFEFQAPCRTKNFPREIPPVVWYRRTLPRMFLAGFFPFSAIYIELYYIFASLWGHKIYTIHSILFIVFIILIIVTVFINVGLTYFQLGAEDHQWWWRSVLRGGSASIFIYCYCFYFYSRTGMTGFLQLSFFFGYNACICYALFLMLGTISFWASLFFVHHIYRSIKLE